MTFLLGDADFYLIIKVIGAYQIGNILLIAWYSLSQKLSCKITNLELNKKPSFCSKKRVGENTAGHNIKYQSSYVWMEKKFWLFCS
jgi:hypothetical protein